MSATIASMKEGDQAKDVCSTNSYPFVFSSDNARVTAYTRVNLSSGGLNASGSESLSYGDIKNDPEFIKMLESLKFESN